MSIVVSVLLISKADVILPYNSYIQRPECCDVDVFPVLCLIKLVGDLCRQAFQPDTDTTVLL